MTSKQKHLQTLNLISQGDWDSAHQTIQGSQDELACQIHGYLHREEGDLNNASYWYDRVDRDIPLNTLEEELDRLYQLADQK